MRKKVKICFVVAVDITIKLILVNYLKLLQKENYQVWVVCSPSQSLKEVETSGIKIKKIKIKRTIAPWHDFWAFLKLFAFFKKEKFDIVQLQTPKAVFLGQLAAKLAGVPIIVNNNFGFYFENFSFIKKKIFIFFERIAAKNVDLMFSINREDINTAIQENIFKKENTQYLGFGIDTDRFNPSKYPVEFIIKKKQSLGIDPSKKVVGIIARLVKEKGYVELCKAFKNVIKVFPNTVLLIVGVEEPEKKDEFKIDSIKNYDIEKNVLFLGERKDIEELYPIMDVYVLPSHREGLGNTILEASLMKIPVVASDIRGCRESVQDGKTGILVPLKNTEKLSHAIIYLLKNPKLRAIMGKAGNARIKKEFSQEIVFNRMKKAYNRLIKEKLPT